MNIFSLILIIASVVYVFMGVYVIYLDKKAALNRLFLALSLCFAFWSFGSALLISALDMNSSMTWNKIASIGYCSFACVGLHLFLVITNKKKILKKWWIYVLIYLPAVVFIFQSFMWDFFIKGYTLGNLGWVLIPRSDSIWFWVYVVQYFTYLCVCLILCYIWQKKSDSSIIKKQGKIILRTAAVTIILASIIRYVALFGKMNIPEFASATILIWNAGIFYAIVNYKLMVMTSEIASEQIFQTIIDSVVIVDPKGLIIDINNETQRLLEYNKDELIGSNIEKLFTEDARFEGERIIKLFKKGPVRNLEVFFISKSGTRIPIILSASACKDNTNNTIGYVVISRDITTLRNIENRLKHLANHDTLTNLPNRLLFKDRLQQALARAKRYKTYVALMLLDLDRFKEVNDVLGHNVGDLLLVQVAKRLLASVRQSDTVVRLGGDEFVIILNDLKQVDDYVYSAQKVLDNIAKVFMIGSNKINITASIGISIYPLNGSDMEFLMKNADLGMYYAKNHGKNRYQLFSQSMSTAVEEKVNLDESLRDIIKNNELVLFYQPVIDISTGMIIGTEALMRWNHPDYGLISPARFLPLAEESGFIVQIGEWVLETAAKQAKTWQDAGYPSVHISVNLSKQQFEQKNLVDKVLEILESTGLEPEYLILEITESTIMDNVEYSIETAKKLHDHKISIIIDNFGAGYSSLLYFRKLPIYAIKVDRFFTTDIANDPECASVFSAIIAMAHNMELKVIAEGIENKGQYESLQSLEWNFVGSPVCDAAQGYLFSKPISSEMVEELFEKQKNGEKLY